MKSSNFLIVSKGRKYYKCKLNDKYDCKLICIDELNIGEKYELFVEDLSVRSKFGTDLIFSSVRKNDANDGIITLKHDRYNEDLKNKCKKLGG